LLEALFARIYFRFEISVFYNHIFCFGFSKGKKSQRRKSMKDKRAVSPDLITPHSICIHVCTLYTYTNTYLPRFSPSGFFGPSKCLVPGPELTSSTACALCVCACVYTPGVLAKSDKKYDGLGWNWRRQCLHGLGWNWRRRYLHGLGWNWRRRCLHGLGWDWRRR